MLCVKCYLLPGRCGPADALASLVLPHPRCRGRSGPAGCVTLRTHPCLWPRPLSLTVVSPPGGLQIQAQVQLAKVLSKATASFLAPGS